jgi:hypothetical protein
LSTLLARAIVASKAARFLGVSFAPGAAIGTMCTGPLGPLN